MNDEPESVTLRMLRDKRLKGLTLGRKLGPAANVAKRKSTAIFRFWQRVSRGTPNECWEWQGYIRPDGYGDVSWNGRVTRSHRIALALTDGDWNSRLPVCHTCDNPLCCNPSHLWRGTQQDNLADMRGKGRARQGVGRRFPQKLGPADVIAIRASNLPAKMLAEQFSLSINYVRHLRMKKSKHWKAL